ncbi:MAG: hypothetical protein ACRELF_04965 [Gemmataceae bacterium]
MTENEWVNEQHRSQTMLLALLRPGKLQRTKAGKRKLRLFACGCCRLVWGLLVDRRLKEAVIVAEQFAEGQTDKTELQAAFSRVIGLTMGGYSPTDPGVRERTAAHMALSATTARAVSAAIEMTAMPLAMAGYNLGDSKGDAMLCHLLRCTFGNPFHPVSVNPVWFSWNSAIIPKLAQTIYEERQLPEGTLDQTRLFILADALEEAGCTDPDILSHLRGSGPHIRSCWVIDCLMGEK